MLDDLFDLFSDLVGGTGGSRLPGAGQQRPSRQNTVPDHPLPKARRQHQTKLTARRDRRGGEDPWDWKEEKPPWEF